VNCAGGGRRAPVWFFDLDNTLHDASHAIFRTINGAMNAYLVVKLGVSEAEADRLRLDYWQRYGATLIGVIRHHGVPADEFLLESHRFDVGPLIRAEKGLRALLARLPGRKVLLTNAPRAYSEKVLLHLGLSRHFRENYSVDQMRIHGHFRVKPSRAMLRAMLAREGVRPRRAILVEDTLANLKSARAVGMRTVHIRQSGTPFAKPFGARPCYVDVQVRSVLDLPRKLSFFR
jgi:putative hydrolase of the HAD superfamily